MFSYHTILLSKLTILFTTGRVNKKSMFLKRKENICYTNTTMTDENTNNNPVSPSKHVKEFHKTYGQVIRTIPNVNVPELLMRLDLIVEEVIELITATLGEEAANVLNKAWEKAKVTRTAGFKIDTVETGDALADLVYVVYGMGLTVGIDIDDLLIEVQASNMSKLGEDGKPIYREDGKVLKGPNFFNPNIPRVLKRQGWVEEDPTN